MAGKLITLTFAGTCRACKSVLPVGSRARWYGHGVVYGLACHADTRTEEQKAASRARYARPIERLSASAPMMAMSSFEDATLTQGIRCSHEDAPACGCFTGSDRY